MTGLFKRKYGDKLKGRVDWIKVLDPEDQQVLIRLGLQAADYGRRGGKVRAECAKRDRRGRFAPGKEAPPAAQSYVEPPVSAEQDFFEQELPF